MYVSQPIEQGSQLSELEQRVQIMSNHVSIKSALMTHHKEVKLRDRRPGRKFKYAQIKRESIRDSSSAFSLYRVNELIWGMNE